MTRITTQNRRAGFTLIELMVVLAIILGVMGLVMAIYPSYSQREELYKASDNVRNAILRARQWAIRDKAITGLEFSSSPSALGAQIRFVQSPHTIIGSSSTLKLETDLTDLTIPNKTLLSNSNNNGNWTYNNSLDNFNPSIKIGDYIITSKPSRINSISSGPKLIFSMSNPVDATVQTFKILRQPVIIQEEPIINLPPSVYVDLQYIVGYPEANSMRLMFSATGQLIPQNTGTTTIRLVQTDIASPLKFNVTSPQTAKDSTLINEIANMTLNESSINIDGSTGITKSTEKVGAK